MQRAPLTHPSELSKAEVQEQAEAAEMLPDKIS